MTDKWVYCVKCFPRLEIPHTFFVVATDFTDAAYQAETKRLDWIVESITMKGYIS